MPSQSISVIIPTLNEAAIVADAIRSCLGENAGEIIVADGGSNDGTEAAAMELGARVIRTSFPQRAHQMNEGAAQAQGDLLVFLHADTLLLGGALGALRSAASRPDLVGGGFRRRYKSRSLVLAMSSRIGNARARHLGWFFGDQAIWVRRHVFDQLGGFPESTLFEDLDFTRKLRRVGPTLLICPGVETSARRFEKNMISRMTRDILLTVRHVCLDPAP